MKVEVDIEEYIALLKESHSAEVAKLEAAHKDCYLYVAYCPADRCEGKLVLKGETRRKCDKCGRVWVLTEEKKKEVM